MSSPSKVNMALFAFLLLIICILTSLLTLSWTKITPKELDTAPLGHHWLHQELSLSEAESASISRFEADYQNERAALLVEFNQQIDKLAGLLVTQNQWDATVESQIHELHNVHGQLQKLSIIHFYQMLDVLPPEKQEQLRAIAVQALSVPE
ncbi:periplasmic heavy metal sensor [Kiritimatiellota bacterium B12222]|nr:periplasmic heavy metal sensor [Kiritimatiellota bacterium B12222]